MGPTSGCRFQIFAEPQGVTHNLLTFDSLLGHLVERMDKERVPGQSTGIQETIETWLRTPARDQHCHFSRRESKSMFVRVVEVQGQEILQKDARPTFHKNDSSSPHGGRQPPA